MGIHESRVQHSKILGPQHDRWFQHPHSMIALLTPRQESFFVKMLSPLPCLGASVHSLHKMQIWVFSETEQSLGSKRDR